MNNLISGKTIFSVINLLLFFMVSIPAHSAKQMPPKFSFDQEPRTVLSNYPLGVINEREAFAHHGGPVRKVILPNGNRGWLYKGGEKAGVPSMYILQLSRDGIVIDVLHKDYRYKLGHSALQYQYLVDKDVNSRTLGPGSSQ